MSETYQPVESFFDKTRVYRTAGFMGISALLTSAAIIVYFNNMQQSEAMYDSMQLAVTTLMPYMISAVIAAITAIGVMTILPTTRVVEPTRQIIAHLNEVAAGDLTVRMRLHADDPLRDVGKTFNSAMGEVGNQVAQWKVLNRQQWGVLCQIRHAVEMNDYREAILFVEQMEKNWDKIAEIEQRFIA